MCYNYSLLSDRKGDFPGLCNHLLPPPELFGDILPATELVVEPSRSPSIARERLIPPPTVIFGVDFLRQEGAKLSTLLRSGVTTGQDSGIITYSTRSHFKILHSFSLP